MANAHIIIRVYDNGASNVTDVFSSLKEAKAYVERYRESVEADGLEAHTLIDPLYEGSGIWYDDENGKKNRLLIVSKKIRKY